MEDLKQSKSDSEKEKKKESYHNHFYCINIFQIKVQNFDRTHGSLAGTVFDKRKTDRRRQRKTLEIPYSRRDCAPVPKKKDRLRQIL